MLIGIGKKVIIIILIPILIGLALTKKAYACSCVIPGTPEEEYSKYDSVFEGLVISIDERYVPTSVPFKTMLFYPPVRIGIQVVTSWKGVTFDHIYVYTGYGSGDCGFNVIGFEVYLFYARGTIDNLQITICSRTAIFSGAKEDRKYLESVDTLKLIPRDLRYEDNLSLVESDVARVYNATINAIRTNVVQPCDISNKNNLAGNNQITGRDIKIILLMSIIVIILILVLIIISVRIFKRRKK